jgi:predicted GIY-YIG superfamily endonuclease
MEMYSVYWLAAPHHTDYNSQGYIGISNNFKHRCLQHKSKTGTHLTRAIKKYGWDNIKKKVLASNLDEEAATLLESMLRPEKQMAWNISPGGQRSIGCYQPVPKETCLRISKALKGIVRSAESRKNYSKSKQGDKNPMTGKFGAECVNFKFVMEATNVKTGEITLLYGGKHMRKLGFDDKKVYTCANGKRKTHKGHTFKRLKYGE